MISGGGGLRMLRGIEGGGRWGVGEVRWNLGGKTWIE